MSQMMDLENKFHNSNNFKDSNYREINLPMNICNNIYSLFLNIWHIFTNLGSNLFPNLTTASERNQIDSWISDHGIPETI